MSKEIQVIYNQKVLDKDFKVYGTADEPLFLAKDVAEWIDYSKTSQGYYNVSKMLMTVDEDKKVTITNRNSDGKPHQQWFLTEDGLYEVLMQSRKPIAKKFKKKVKEILKEIRKTGSYTSKPLTTVQMFSLQAKINEEHEKKLLEQQLKLENHEERLQRVEQQVKLKEYPYPDKKLRASEIDTLTAQTLLATNPIWALI